MATRANGFTLAEVVVALAIFATGIMGVIGAYSLSMDAGSRGIAVEDAARLAANRLELAVAAAQEGLPQQTGTEGRYNWTVSYASKPHNLMVAAVVIEWAEKNQPRRYKLERVFRPQ